METDEDIKLEFGGELEPGASTGWRSATSIPRFTKDELEKGLGTDVNDQIEELFSRIASFTFEDLPEPEGAETEPEPIPGKSSSR